MKPRTLLLALAALGLSLAAPACLDAPRHLYGYDLSEHRLSLYALDMGVHPSTSVLEDPNNPFRFDGVGDETKWDIQSDANAHAAFYAWATILAQRPHGEAQFYAAQALQRIYDGREVTDVELPFVKDMALAAYEAVLEHFPDSVTYDPSGTVPYRLAPMAYEGIVDLGGTLPPGWQIVATADGGTTIIPVPSEATDAEPVEEEE